jgi:hypothetical protein
VLRHPLALGLPAKPGASGDVILFPVMNDRSAAARKAWKTRKTVGTIETEVLADLPLNVDLTRRTSRRTLTFQIKTGGALLGTLHMGRGSVQWFTAKAKKPTGE